MYANETKRQRAIKQLKDQAREKGVDMSTFVPAESDIKALYLKFGGLFIEEPKVEKKEEVKKEKVEKKA